MLFASIPLLEATCGSAAGAAPRGSDSTADTQEESNSLLRAVLEDLFRQMIFHVGLIAHDLVVGGAQQLGTAVA